MYSLGTIIFKFLCLRILGFLTLIAMFAMDSCSTFYYFPDRYGYVKVEKLPIPPENFYISIEQNLRIHGWRFLHSEKEKSAKAVILQFHGNGQNLSSHFAHLYFALEHKFDLVTFDYEGYGKSEGTPSPAHTTRDGIAVLRWVQEHYPTTPLIIVGQSLGGAIALKTLVEFQKQSLLPPITMVMIDSSFSNYRSTARSIMAKSWWTWWMQPIAWSIVDNSASPESELKQLSSLRFFVTHGDQDKVVPFELGEHLFEQLPKDKKFFKVPSGQHTDFFFHDQGLYQKPWVDMVDHILLHGTWPTVTPPYFQLTH